MAGLPDRRSWHLDRAPTVDGMTIILDSPAAAPQPLAGYSQLARIDLGATTLLQLSGQVAAEADRTVVGAGDIVAQARHIFATIAALLAAHGATLGDIVHIRTFMTDLALLPGYAEVRRELFTHRPASTTVEVAGLFVEGALLEIEVLAAVTRG